MHGLPRPAHGRRPTVLVAVVAALALLTAGPSVAAPSAPPEVPAGSTTTVPTSASFDGLPRSVVVHVPDGLLASAPLVVALHAHSQGPQALREYSRLEELADEQGFVVAFPDGAGGSWNAGGCCYPGSVELVDDVVFLDEVVEVVRERVPVDPARIFVTGGSNGAMMALRYACERPQVVAAVAVVAGPYVAECVPPEPVPVLVLQGADDTAIPLAGGANPALRVTLPPVDESLEPFRAAGGEVSLVVVPRTAHAWMTLEEHDVDATRLLWNWLRDHPRPL